MKYLNCGPNCLAVALGAPLSQSSRSDRGWVHGATVVAPIVAGGHDPSHPFHTADGVITRARRRQLLDVVLRHSPRGTVPVTGLCACTVTMPLLDGAPLYDFALGPDGRRLVSLAGRERAWPLDVLVSLLADLVAGLRALHGVGIAHGDAALMNAFVERHAEGLRGVWVDLGSICPATEETCALDVAAFTEACLWPALLEAPTHSPALAYRVLATIRDNEGLAGIEAALREPLTDELGAPLRRAFGAVGDHAHSLEGDGADARARRRVVAMMAPIYFLDQTRTDQVARFFEGLLRAERARHVLVEEEATRLHHLRFSDELDRANAAVEELRSWAGQLQEAVDFHSTAGQELGEALEQAAERERALADERDALRAEVEALHVEVQALRHRGLGRLRRSRS